jgi:hypothetical protein
MADIDLSALLGVGVQWACPLAQHARLYLSIPLLNQQQQQDEAEMLDFPAYEVGESAGHGSISSADSEDASDAPGMASSSSRFSEADEPAEVDSNKTVQQQPCNSRRLRRAARAASWSGPGFTIEPAPDAAAVLTHSSASSAHQQQQHQQHQQQRVVKPVHHGSYSQLMYLYDLLSPASDSANARGAGADPKLLKVRWTAASPQQSNDDAARSAMWAMHQQPRFTTSRYTTGSGNLHGGLVVEVRQAPEAAAAAGAHNMSMCIFQVVPWQIRLWLHTLQLSIDGQVSQH